jgi:DNA-binding Lrp family transcriptional regulator
MDEIDRALIVATQGGLPLVARPYHTIGEQIGIAGEEVMRRMQALLNGGIIRRIGAVPNHYAIGWTANGMTVWDVTDDKVDELDRSSVRCPL